MPRSPKWSLSLRFPHQNPICTSPSMHTHTHTRTHMRTRAHTHTHTHHVILLDLITWTEADNESPYYVSPTFPCYLVLFRPKYLPQRPVLKHLSLCSYRNVRDKVSHPHETRWKTTSLCILSFIFWIANWKTEFLDWMVTGITWVQFALNFFMNAILIVMVVAKSLNFATQSKIYYLSLCCDFFTAFCSWAMTTYLVCLAFNSIQISSLPHNKASAFSFIVHMLSPNKLASSA